MSIVAASAQSLNEGINALYSDRFNEAKNQLKGLIGKGNDAEIYFYLGKVNVLLQDKIFFLVKNYKYLQTVF